MKIEPALVNFHVVWMPRTNFLVNAVVAHENLLVVRQTVPAKLVLAVNACCTTQKMLATLTTQ